jgi:hypothetical protein
MLRGQMAKMVAEAEKFRAYQTTVLILSTKRHSYVELIDECSDS